MLEARERNLKWASDLSDDDLLAELTQVATRIAEGFGEHGGSPGEWWYERADEIDQEMLKRGL
jgi:hypothetical protein